MSRSLNWALYITHTKTCKQSFLPKFKVYNSGRLAVSQLDRRLLRMFVLYIFLCVRPILVIVRAAACVLCP